MLKKLLLSIFTVVASCAWSQDATVRIDAQKKYQQITGFGGFVCSPQFTYNHMNNAEIDKVWGKSSTVGCNIMRLYIPIGRNSWAQSLATAKYAKQKGLIVFASPWGQPAEWKTNGTINAKNEDGTIGKLKREYWDDYAVYLNDYVKYMRDNGVELDAISIQNEPDWTASYAGCIWSASEIAEFVKTYGRQINCKIIAPETLGTSSAYVNELNKADVLPNFDIYGGHQYGGIEEACKKLGQQGKQVWMTEFLINWNENTGTTRNFDYSKDVFNFFRSINTCMLNDFNAWIHYAAKRYYGMIGDGQCGTANGEMTKRGYVMAHFAKYITGMTRIDAQWNDNAAQPLEGSAYLSQTGDTVVAVLINPSDNERIVTFDLPFYTQRGRMQTTTPSKNLSPKDLRQKTETCRPQVTIAAQSVATLIFARSRDRQPSQMTGSVNRFDRIDDMTCTNSAFGTTYKMSGKTFKFDHSNPLVSARTNAANGYIQLTDRFDQLVLNIKKVTSTLNYTSAKTTLCYVNAKGQVATHDYGELDLNGRENFNLTLDLSPKTLPDGCRGIISITNNNWSSTLTITFGDVYLSNGGHYAATLSGQYGADDSYLLDYTADGSCTSIDMTSVTTLPASFDWLNGNRVVYVSDGNNVSGSNIVIGSECQQLLLADDGSDFRPAKQFNAAEAQLTLTIDGYRLLMLPFAAELPQGVYAYSIGADMTLQPLTVIPAHHPVLVEAQGVVVLKGSGAVSFARSPLADLLRGAYTQIPLYEGDYLLGKQNGEWGFVRQNTSATLTPFGVYVQLSSTASFIPLNLSVTGITDVRHDADAQSAPLYNVMGQRVGKDHKGIVIRKGVKIVNKK